MAGYGSCTRGVAHRLPISAGRLVIAFFSRGARRGDTGLREFQLARASKGSRDPGRSQRTCLSDRRPLMENGKARTKPRFGQHVWLAALAAGIVCLVPRLASAQQIGGTVTDSTGAVLPGVSVEARSPALIEQVRNVVTNEAGQYLIVALEPGVYSVTYTLTGFRTVVREGVKLSSGFTASIDTQLP